MHGFEDANTGQEHIALVLGNVADEDSVLCRVHSECLTGDCLFSMRCDCGAQLEHALRKISERGQGVILYLRQEGRGIGLSNKIRAYKLQDQGLDTVEANHQLGFSDDERNYEIVYAMANHLNIISIDLMTNNPKKIEAIEKSGLKVNKRIPIKIESNDHNRNYLDTKAKKLGHLM